MLAKLQHNGCYFNCSEAPVDSFSKGLAFGVVLRRRCFASAQHDSIYVTLSKAKGRGGKVYQRLSLWCSVASTMLR